MEILSPSSTKNEVPSTIRNEPQLAKNKSIKPYESQTSLALFLLVERERRISMTWHILIVGLVV
jgi:hypothetical protein